MDVLKVKEKEDSELVIIVDKKNQVVGQATRKEMREKNLPHRCTYIFVLQKGTDKLFCHQRSPLKRYCPSYFDTNFGGVVAVGETYESNALKELREEAGVVKEKLESLQEFYYEDNTVQTQTWGKIFYLEFDGEPINMVAQPEEVEFIELMSMEEISARSLTGDLFTPDGLMALKILRDNLKKQQNPYGLLFPVLSGFCGALASYGGKLAFQGEGEWYMRLIGLCIMLYLNKWMMQLNFKSMQINGSSITVLLQFMCGNLLNGINGYLLGESVSQSWLLGMTLMGAGVWMISGQNK